MSKKSFWQKLPLRKLFRYAMEVAIAALILEMFVLWFGEKARWSNNFCEIVNAYSGKISTQDDINAIMTMLSTHHQSLANLLTITGLVVTVVTIIFYLENQDHKKEVDDRVHELTNNSESIRLFGTCQQLIDSILQQLWVKTDKAQGNSLEVISEYITNSVTLRSLLSKDGKVFMSLGILKQLVENNKDITLYIEVEQLLRNLHKIGKFDNTTNLGIANSILELIDKPLLNN
ncbi:MAG: hypothetical protein R3E08_13445 [Thiotrichaceae bacterium]